ncbi:MAG TPA: hypothetical protein VFG23_16180 [Polyangia bacterium]|nr:hypothetical protein [Polyangia bacterium]
MNSTRDRLSLALTRMGPSALLILVALSAAGCKPDLGAPPSLVTGPQILAIRGTPPEAAESATVTYDALAVDVTGTIAAPPFDWAQCLAPDPPANGNDVSSACLTIPDDAGPAPTFMAALPDDACMLFGPETPPPQKGQPPARPADPDTTGGYYQPIRATWSADSGQQIAFALERILCRLANAPVDAAGQYASDYVPNQNPQLADLIFDPAGAATPLFSAGQTAMTPGTIAAGQTVTLQADWTDASTETFLVWDVVSLNLVLQQESLRLSWFATGGSFLHDASGRSATETETFTQNSWTAPDVAGPVHFWTVLRDDRGGIDFAEAEIDVTP